MKVEIVIESQINNDGKPYTSVGFMASHYGSGSPCDTPEDIASAIEHAKEWIKREGDIPIVKDTREGKGQLRLSNFDI
jgi:hypothetical protein